MLLQLTVVLGACVKSQYDLTNEFGIDNELRLWVLLSAIMCKKNIRFSGPLGWHSSMMSLQGGQSFFLWALGGAWAPRQLLGLPPLSAVLVANPRVASSMNHMSLRKCFPPGRLVSLEDKMIIVDVADVMSHDLNTM